MSTRILLVEDHEIVRQGVRSLFEKESGIEIVAEAGDGRTAVALVSKHLPDIVVMDIGLPDLNGIEATRLDTGWGAKREGGGAVVTLGPAFCDRHVAGGGCGLCAEKGSGL